jgi:hypothetical protein
MNTNHHRSAWGVGFAAFALTMVTACGSEIATAPGSPNNGADVPSSPSPRSSCSGSVGYYGECMDEGGSGGGPRTSGSGFGPQ